MSPVYDVPIRNDGEDHPDWRGDGPVESHATCWAETPEAAREKVARGFPSDLGWEVGEPQEAGPPGSEPTFPDGEEDEDG